MFVILRIVKFENPKDFGSEIEFQEFVTLKVNEEAILGRSRNCEARIPDDYCSSEHCRFEFDGKDLYLEDLKSKNGTKLNGILVEDRIAIYHKDIVILGSTFIHIDEDRTPKEVLNKLRRAEDGSISMPFQKNYQEITNTKIKKI